MESEVWHENFYLFFLLVELLQDDFSISCLVKLLQNDFLISHKVEEYQFTN